MKKSDSVYIGSACFAALFSLFYFAIVYFKIRVPRYYPLEHTWRWENLQGVISQVWYGMLGGALIGAGIISMIIYFMMRYVIPEKSSVSHAITRLTGILAILITAAVMIWLDWHEFQVIKK